MVTASGATHGRATAPGRAGAWLSERVLRRVAVVDAILADYATAICGRAVRRRELRPDGAAGPVAGVTWSIDGDVIVTFIPALRRRRVAVHEIGVLQPIRKQLRSRHVVVEHAGGDGRLE